MLAKTIINYTMKDQPIFIVAHLTDRAFAHGFRVLNPEFKATHAQVELGEEALEDCLFVLNGEVNDLFHNYKVNTPMNPRQRAEAWMLSGEDR